MSSKPNQFKRVLDLNAAQSFLDGSKTAQVARQDEQAVQAAMTPVQHQAAPVATSDAPTHFVTSQEIDQIVEADLVPEPPKLAQLEAAAAPKPEKAPTPAVVRAVETQVILRPDGTPASDRLPVQVNFKMVETKYWQVKDFVGSTPRLSLQQFLVDAAMEKMARMQAEAKK